MQSKKIKPLNCEFVQNLLLELQISSFLKLCMSGMFSYGSFLYQVFFFQKQCIYGVMIAIFCYRIKCLGYLINIILESLV